MTGFLQQKSEENFNIESAVAGLIRSYYGQRQDRGEIDDDWLEISEQDDDTDSTDEIVQKFTQTVSKSPTNITAGSVLAFDYISLKGVRKSYFVVVVATKKGNGMYSNINTRRTLMTSFLIDSGTNLDTLAIVMDVINSEKIKNTRKSYKGLVNPYTNRALRRKTGISQEGMAALFSTTQFRTFAVDVGLTSVYRINLDG
jgi:hypothetical protein